MTGALVVRVADAAVGRLWLDERKLFCFQYDPLWLERSRIPLSLSLPLRAAPYLDDESHPFFANLLPEERIRVTIARNLGLSPNNDFGMLEKIGGDCAGAVSISRDEGRVRREPSRYRQLSDDDLFAIIRELPLRPLLAGEEGIRLSLAGAQKKLPVFYDGVQFSLGYGSCPSNHIIKPAIDNLDGSVENEAFCMTLAREVGLEAPRCFIHQHDGVRIFVVERYDRVPAGEGTLRLHQEDFCQALGIAPEFKYESEGGPSLAACFDLVRRTSVRSGRDLLSLVDWTIFNYLIGNSDAHGKNLSLLLLPEGPMLAPFYDQLSTRIYAHYGLSDGLAMTIGGEGDPGAIRKEHWERFAREAGVKPRLVLTRVSLLMQRVEAARLLLFKGAFASYRCDALYRLMELIAAQSEQILRRVG